MLSVAALSRSGGTSAGSAVIGAFAATAFPVVALIGCGLLAASVVPLLGRAMTDYSEPARLRPLAG
ncbi:hypothetical protein [Jannaschia sp. R86511]|uniref:hypothetical protein n=1 Tax=Jannaschia sp. R86511 TaxID=3093853 RepID=UPI0036D31714